MTKLNDQFNEVDSDELKRFKRYVTNETVGGVDNDILFIKDANMYCISIEGNSGGQANSFSFKNKEYADQAIAHAEKILAQL